MIFLSLFPPEVIWQEQKGLEPEIRMVKMQGIDVLVKNKRGQLVLERVLSTNPADYLRTEFQPGCDFKQCL